MSLRIAVATALAIVLGMHSGAPVAGAAPDDVYQAIRADDLAKLKTLLGSAADVSAPGPDGVTPLMLAAGIGSLDAVKWLLERGASIDAQNAFGSTALMWAATQPEKVRLLLDRGANPNLATKTGRTALFVAAMSEQSAPIVRALIAKGADIRVRDAFGNTMALAAAVGNDVETIRLVVDAGVDVNAAGATDFTPLVAASYHGNLRAVELLLAKGARVNAVARKTVLFPPEDPKSGPISLGNVTPLLAAASQYPAVVRRLVEAGADVNATDVRGMTPLMLAVASDTQDPATIRLLLERGADVTLRSKSGETAGDWARKTGVRAGIELLKVEPLAAPRPSTASASSAGDARAAAERALALLETSSQKFFDSSGCVSCHHQNATNMAVGEARAHGLKVNADRMIDRMKMMAAAPPAPLLMERMDIGVPEILASAAAGIAALDAPANLPMDLIVANIAAMQAADGSWHVLNGTGDRPPTGGAVTRAALCIRTLRAYAPPARAAEMSARIARARDWLLAATPATAEEANMRLLGLHWAGVDAARLKPLAAKIAESQQPDGGWRQREGLPTDAYATGQSLYALAKAGGATPADPLYKRGVAYLLATQSDTGAWRVASRSPKFQAYFNSAFPYAGDQWISAWATGWAAMALAQTLP
jgi:ankyrin repeat protein